MTVLSDKVYTPWMSSAPTTSHHQGSIPPQSLTVSHILSSGLPLLQERFEDHSKGLGTCEEQEDEGINLNNCILPLNC